MVQLFYGDNEPTWVIGNASHPVRAYMQQPARDYDTPYSYTDRQYTANRYMQPARDYEIPTYTDGQYTASRYMQPARDYEIPIYTQGQYTASRYMQPARDYETAPAYANGQYTASRYMQPARDYEFPTYDEDRHYTTNRYLQPARDHQIPTYTDKHYTSSRYVEPARDYETPTYTGSQYTVSRYMQPSRDHEVRPYTDMHQVSPYDMQYAARHEIPMTHPSENWPRQYSVGSTPSSRNQQVPLSNQTGAARSKNPLVDYSSHKLQKWTIEWKDLWIFKFIIFNVCDDSHTDYNLGTRLPQSRLQVLTLSTMGAASFGIEGAIVLRKVRGESEGITPRHGRWAPCANLGISLHTACLLSYITTYPLFSCSPNGGETISTCCIDHVNLR